MRVEQAKEDNCGRWPLWFYGYNLKEIHEWLYKNYQGYTFCICLDETKDEFEDLERPVPVYFADELLEELAYKYDYKVVKKIGV